MAERERGEVEHVEQVCACAREGAGQRNAERGSVCVGPSERTNVVAELP